MTLAGAPLFRRLAAVHLPGTVALARMATAVLVIVLGVTLARMTWSFWPLPAEPSVPPPSAATVAPTHGAGLDQVAALHLFGLSATTVSGAPATSLALTLRGVVATGETKTALAIIDSGSGERAYHIGDRLPGGAVLKEIARDRVLIERDGRYESLALPKANGGTGGAGTGTGPVTGAASTAAANPLERYSALANRDPGRLLSMVGAEPVRQNGALVGYRLGQGPLSSYAERYGMRPGDVVTALNGVALTGPQAFAQALASLRGAATAQLTVERDGQPRQVLLPLQP